MKNNNILVEKSYAFALRVVKLRRYLLSEKDERDMSKQILRSGTSIGANVEEAIGAQSKRLVRPIIGFACCVTPSSSV